MVTVKMTLGYDDFLKYAIINSGSFFIHKIMRYIIGVSTLLVFVAVLILTVVRNNDDSAGIVLKITGAFFVAVAVAFFLYLPAWVLIKLFVINKLVKAKVKAAARKEYASKPTGWYACELELNNSGIDCRNNAGGHKFCNWDTISRIVENNEALYLYYGRNRAFIVPKRFLSHAETDTVKQLCLLKSQAGSINGKPLNKK